MSDTQFLVGAVIVLALVFWRWPKRALGEPNPPTPKGGLDGGEDDD